MSFGAEFGKIVRNRRMAAKLTEKRLAAKALGAFDKAPVIEDLEAGRMPRPASSVVSALADALRIDWDEISRCRNAANAALAAAGAPVRLIEAITRSYEESRPRSDSAAKRAYLSLKLEEYKAIRSNLAKVAHQGDKLRMMAESVRRHLEGGDIDAAEAMLDRADRLRQHESMRAIMRRELASVALLSGRAARAAKLYEEAAELLEQFSPDGAAEIRETAGGALYQHALAVGAGWELPVVFYRQLRKFYNRFKEPECWARTENNLANALFAEAMQATKPARARLLPQVIEGYRAALSVFTRTVKPARWAQARYNMAKALSALAELVGRREAEELLTEASEHMNDALNARNPGANPGLWATTAHDYAMLLCRRAEAIGPKGIDLLAEAARIQTAALRILSIETTPDHWAAANNSLANIQRKRAAWADQSNRSLHLEDAVSACRNALKVYNRSQDPAAWASVQNNLALALKDQARQLSREESAAAYKEAAKACQAALEVRTAQAAPRAWASLQTTLAKALCGAAAATGGAEGASIAAKAQAAAEAALKVHTRRGAPRNWAEGLNLLAVALETRADLEPSRAKIYLTKAVDALKETSGAMGGETPAHVRKAIRRNLARLEARLAPVPA